MIIIKFYDIYKIWYHFHIICIINYICNITWCDQSIFDIINQNYDIILLIYCIWKIHAYYDNIFMISQFNTMICSLVTVVTRQWPKVYDLCTGRRRPGLWRAGQTGPWRAGPTGLILWDGARGPALSPHLSPPLSTPLGRPRGAFGFQPRCTARPWPVLGPNPGAEWWARETLADVGRRPGVRRAAPLRRARRNRCRPSGQAPAGPLGSCPANQPITIRMLQNGQWFGTSAGARAPVLAHDPGHPCISLQKFALPVNFRQAIGLISKFTYLRF